MDQVIKIYNSLSEEAKLSIISGASIALFTILLERIVEGIRDWIANKRQRNHASEALNTEIEFNYSLCDTIISSLKPVHHSVFNFARFNTYWLTKYCELYIDYRNKDSLRLHSFLHGANTLIGQIEDIQANQQRLSVSGRALGSFTTLAHNNNQSALNLSISLKEILSCVKKLRRNNIMKKGDIDKYINPKKTEKLAVEKK